MATPTAASVASPQLPQTPIQLPTTPTATLLSPTKAQQAQPTIIRMASPATGIIRTVGQNVVRVRGPAPTNVGGQQIKVVGSTGQIIKSTTVTQAGNMSGIGVLAAAAAATSKISSAVTGTTVTAASSMAGQTIKVVQAAGNVITAGGKPIQAGQIATIGGQTVRLATAPGGTLLKAGSTITSQGGKQIILQKQGNQPQIVTLVKTSQGMQVMNILKNYLKNFEV